MRRGIGVLIFCVLFSGSAFAGHKHYHHRHHHYVHIAKVHSMPEGLGVGLIHMLKSIDKVQTAAGPVIVATRLADRFQGLIRDFVEAGYRPKEIGCFARSGHVRHSRHYLGEACDFDQTGWGKTAHFMYTREADTIIRKWGFTNGCSFRDCGHVGTDGQHARRYAKI